MQSNVWLVASAWMALARIASLISIRVGISVALIEILVGVVAGNCPGLHTTAWIDCNSHHHPGPVHDSRHQRLRLDGRADAHPRAGAGVRRPVSGWLSDPWSALNPRRSRQSASSPSAAPVAARRDT